MTVFVDDSTLNLVLAGSFLSGIPKDSFAPKVTLAGSVKDFRCGPHRMRWVPALFGPRWKSSQGGSRGKLGSVYGESVLAVMAADDGDRSKVRKRDSLVPA